MTNLTEPLRQHHKHCDTLLAMAEDVVAKRDWSEANTAVPTFIAEMEAHFLSEEEALFPAFETATGMTMGPTRVMRLEHAQMRDLFAQLRSALTARDQDLFAGVAETLLILMQQHNMKEENILYPMCDRSLAAQAGSLGATLHDRLEASCPLAG